MYLRSAPLQKTPSTPESTTTRTSSLRASARPARRRSCAVRTSSELKRSARSIVMYPTASATRVRMCSRAGCGVAMSAGLRHEWCQRWHRAFAQDRAACVEVPRSAEHCRASHARARSDPPARSRPTRARSREEVPTSNGSSTPDARSCRPSAGPPRSTRGRRAPEARRETTTSAGMAAPHRARS